MPWPCSSLRTPSSPSRGFCSRRRTPNPPTTPFLLSLTPCAASPDLGQGSAGESAGEPLLCTHSPPQGRCSAGLPVPPPRDFCWAGAGLRRNPQHTGARPLSGAWRSAVRSCSAPQGTEWNSCRRSRLPRADPAAPHRLPFTRAASAASPPFFPPLENRGDTPGALKARLCDRPR